MTDSKTTAKRRAPIAIPKGGFTNNPDEAAWLAETVAMRFQEGISATFGISLAINLKQLTELFLISLNAASKRGGLAATALATASS